MRTTAAILVAVILIAFAACGRSDRIHPDALRRRTPPIVVDPTQSELALQARGEEARAVRNYWVHVDRASRSKRRPSARSAPTALQGVVQVTTGNWADLIASYPWPWQTAYRIMVCESGGNPNARNRHSSATGLFQILRGSTDPAANVRQAFAMWQGRGWRPWNASKRCWA